MIPHVYRHLLVMAIINLTHIRAHIMVLLYLYKNTPENMFYTFYYSVTPGHRNSHLRSTGHEIYGINFFKPILFPINFVPPSPT